ncbi:histidine phosphatase family protein [Pedobacter duraquae]|uniref:Histidine phosphatase superfamily protein (Branch 1) n=1 Tax=Pedobacter duraquae TaxID=425511 RepID=A0A4R6IRH1_9SPHI|nr:histidine phosphatase family protein [Pedobacter duraquae]TDO24475.1 hypothetical protein CLV32_0764 [Pedobacter duraquae]
MNKICTAILLIALAISSNAGLAQSKDLKLVFIRHAEKPADGDNLSCQGLNRSLQLPAVLMKKFGKPSAIYVPALNLGKTTKRMRMLQTITPFAVKYNLAINSKYTEEDPGAMGDALLKEAGIVIIVWDHNSIQPMLKKLGMKKTGSLTWLDNDYDSMWIVSFSTGKPVLSKDAEGIRPAAGCSF